MRYDELTLTSESVRRLKRTGCLLLLALLLAACSIDVSDVRPSAVTPALRLTLTTATPLTPPSASPTALPWASLHLAGHLIFLQNPNHEELVQLDLLSGTMSTLFHAENRAWLAAAAVSPDGQRVVMAYSPPPKDSSQLPGYTDLYLLPADGSGTPQVLLQRVAPEEAFAFPQWSADGHFVYYEHVIADTTAPPERPSFRFTIERVAYPNGQPEKILDDAIWPRLSPDGKKLAYVSFKQQTGENNLRIANADGSNSRLVMPAGAFFAVDAPVFSSDGQAIMFSAVGGPQLPSLSWLDQLLGVQIAEAHDVASDWWRVSINGGKPERLTHIGDIGLYADFAPDGQYVAFASLSGVFVMKPDGSNLTKLVGDALGGSICWTP